MTRPSSEVQPQHSEAKPSAGKDARDEPQSPSIGDVVETLRELAMWTDPSIDVTPAELLDQVAALILSLQARVEAAERERDEAQREAVELACWMARTLYPEAPGFKTLDYPAGVISQIDNMLAGVVYRRLQPAEAEVSRLSERIRGAVEVIRPFADLADQNITIACVGEGRVQYRIDRQHFKAAGSFLQSLEGGGSSVSQEEDTRSQGALRSKGPTALDPDKPLSAGLSDPERHELECLRHQVGQLEYPCSPHCEGYLRELAMRNGGSRP